MFEEEIEIFVFLLFFFLLLFFFVVVFFFVCFFVVVVDFYLLLNVAVNNLSHVRQLTSFLPNIRMSYDMRNVLQNINTQVNN